MALSLLVVLVAVVETQGALLGLPFEGIDVDSILRNEKLINKHVKCIRMEGRCDTNGKSLKTMLPRVLNENCAGCSEEQVFNANKIIEWMKRNRAADWAYIRPLYSYKF